MHLKRDIADIRRFKEIIGIIFDEGFHYILEKTSLNKFVPIRKKLIRVSNENASDEVRLRRALERLGPTFIKFGQLLSIRPDFVPKNYIEELEKLQDQAPSFAFEEVKKAIEESTGKRLGEIFKRFDEVPVASASIAQVHKAVLKTGEVVAVKIKRPAIDDIMQKDIEIMFFIAELLEKHVKTIEKYKPTQIVEEFSDWTKRELNFLIEADNIDTFYKNFKKSKTTKIPKVYNQFSNRRIIVMEYIEGIPLHKISGARAKGIDIREVMKNGFYSILEQVFVHGFFHGDPHSSNILITKKNVVAFVDFGIVGKFNDKLKEKAGDLFVGIMEGDSDKVVDVLLEIGTIDEGADIVKFKSKVDDIIIQLRGTKLKDAKVSRILEEVFAVALEYGIRMPREFVLFGKAIVTIEGAGLMYYPDFRFEEMAAPFIEELVLKKYEPKKIMKGSILKFLGLKKTLENIPGQATRVLEKLEKGKIKIEMKDTDIEKLSVELDKSSNRITYGMIIAALLVSGSLVINVGNRVLYGLPLISTLCFAAAGVLSIMLFVSIVQEKKERNDR